MASKQVVLITGSSTGFGRMFAETLARNGHTVFATMRDPAVRNAANATELRKVRRGDGAGDGRDRRKLGGPRGACVRSASGPD